MKITLTLKLKFLAWTLLLVAGLIGFGFVSVWNLVSLRRVAQATTAAYDAMDRADATVLQVAWLRDALRGADSARYRDPTFFAPIRTEADEIVRELRLGLETTGGDARAELDHALAAQQHVTDAAAPNTSADAAATKLESARLSLLAVANLVPGTARRQTTGAADRLLSRIEWTCFWLMMVLAISALIHFMQYRTLVRPLLWLREDMRASRSKQYQTEVAARSRDDEFGDVAGLFNGLARELAELYRDLEAKVIARSRELVRSERLASVGFLAAGVAHEINNPLTVIAGYAELAMKALTRVMNGGGGGGGGSGSGSDDRGPCDAEAEAEAEALSGALDSQTIIRDEAFRCKEITGRLLSLARGGGDAREPLRLDDLARQVAVLTKGLTRYRDRRVIADFDSSESLDVVANATEMKQVLLNLTVNALEAVPPQRGEVRLTGRRSGEWVEVAVEDNGKGMSADTLQNVFEPFFTNKRGAGDPGTGLGLSITHAIVENHGGRIRAESAGVGRGSRFSILLPAKPAAQRTPARVAAARS